MKWLLFILVIISTIGQASAQNSGQRETHLEFKGVTVESKSGNVGGPSGSQVGEKSQSTSPPNVSINSLRVPESSLKLSPVSAEYFARARLLFKTMGKVKALLVGNIVCGLITNEPIEQLTSISLTIPNGDWLSVAKAFKNLSTIEQQQLSELSFEAATKVEEQMGSYRSAGKDVGGIVKEVQFWKGLQQVIPDEINDGHSPFSSLKRAGFYVEEGIQIIETMNTTVDGRLGMKIHPKITVIGGSNVEFSVVAYFCLEDGEKLIDMNGLYSTQDGQVCTHNSFISCCEKITTNAIDSHFYLFIPYDELHLLPNELTRIKYYVAVSAYGRVLERSDWRHSWVSTK